MRDVNGQMHWAMNSAESFGLEPDNANLVWDEGCHAVRLASRAEVEPSTATKPQMRAAANAPTLIVDRYETWARVDGDNPHRVVAGGVDRDTEVILELTPGQEIVDLDLSDDGDLFACVAQDSGGLLIWADTLGRFDPVQLRLEGLNPDRVVVTHGGGPVWVLDREAGTLAQAAGVPMPGPIALFDPPGSGFAADPAAPDMPRLEPMAITLPAGPPILDAAALDGGWLAVLREGAGAGGNNRLDWITPEGAVIATELNGVRRGFSITGFDTDRVALVAPGWREARLYARPGWHAGTTETDIPLRHPEGERLPLAGWSGERLGKGSARPATYPTISGQGAIRPWARLAPLSTAAFAREGMLRSIVIDTGMDGFVWHRLYIEADLPRGCMISVGAIAWDVTHIGEDGATEATSNSHVFAHGHSHPVRPTGVWVDMPSEHPHGRNHLPDGSERIKDRRGLFTCQMQGRKGPMRRLQGRYLRLYIGFGGTGGATPRLHALRVWGPRFSYRDRYLPELYQITKGPGAEGSDFLERYLNLFESFLTPLEAQIAEAWRGASATSAPAEALDWLGGWLGLEPDGALGETGKRRLIGGAAEQSLWHGTLRGLEMALDLATDGGVADGRVVVVENFNLRRTFATILGADFDDRDDPLTRGTRANANSVLGPSFFLGASEQKALFALLRPEMLDHDLTRPEERAAALDQLEAMEERTAFRVTILLHDGLDEAQRGLVQAVLDREVPAHVQAQVFDAPQSLLLGLSALLGVETRLGPGRTPEPFILDHTELGQAQLTGLPALDPRLEP